MRAFLLLIILMSINCAGLAQMINTTRDFVGVEIVNDFDSSILEENIDETVAQNLVEAECTRIGSKLGSVSINDCLELNLKVTGSFSNNEAPLLYKEYPPLPSRAPLARVLLMGGVHGDEYSSVSVIFKWLKTLDEFHSGLFHWRVSPLVNPDGLLRDGST
ncbi:MAG: hypothetical protein HKN08_06540, partial [Gammaproteobacteria bacterium]|nr:hypothetical protein [Gammaproteobacteria bacterium]